MYPFRFLFIYLKSACSALQILKQILAKMIIKRTRIKLLALMSLIPYCLQYPNTGLSKLKCVTVYFSLTQLRSRQLLCLPSLITVPAIFGSSLHFSPHTPRSWNTSTCIWKAERRVIHEIALSHISLWHALWIV